MSHERPFNLPTLRETFGGNINLMRSLVNAGFKTVTPVMMLPYGAIQEQGNGIRSQADSSITKLLQRQDLKRHTVSEKMTTFLSEQFGALENAPVGALQVAIVRKGLVSYPTYAPLELITLLEEHEPHMSILDLLRMNRKELLYIAEGKPSKDPAVHDAREDIRHIEARLDTYGSALAFAPVVKLHVVGR